MHKSISYDRFKRCFEIPHWHMPSIQTLSRIAKQTVSTLIIHVPIIHMPTFRMAEVSAALSFALSVVGSPRHSAIAGDRSRKVLDSERLAQLRALDVQSWMRGEGIIAPDASAPQVEMLEDAPTDEEKRFEDNKPVSLSARMIFRDEHTNPESLHQIVVEDKLKMVKDVSFESCPTSFRWIKLILSLSHSISNPRKLRKIRNCCTDSFR
jgi:hypothetical protein